MPAGSYIGAWLSHMPAARKWTCRGAGEIVQGDVGVEGGGWASLTGPASLFHYGTSAIVCARPPTGNRCSGGRAT